MKKYFIFFLACLLSFSFVACNGFESTSIPNTSSDDNSKNEVSAEPSKETSVDDFTWTEIEGGIEIIAYKGNSKRVVVPEIINNKKVVSIGTTFDGNVIIEELVLPRYIDCINIKGCDNLRYLEMQCSALCGEITKFDEPICQIPSVEELYLPNATYFSSFNLSEAGKLKKLNVPFATGIWCDGLNNLSEIVFSEDIAYDRYVYDPEYREKHYRCFLTAMEDDDRWGANRISMCDEWTIVYNPITDENASEVYCSVFGVDSIIVNGVAYSK